MITAVRGRGVIFQLSDIMFDCLEASWRQNRRVTSCGDTRRETRQTYVGWIGYTMTTLTKKTFPYWAFLSYSHDDNLCHRRQWATWLQQALERYRIPADLLGTTNQRGETIPELIFPVFRDEEELPVDADLGLSVRKALDESRFLIVLFSPGAVASRYVAEEIAYYKKIGHDRPCAGYDNR